MRLGNKTNDIKYFKEYLPDDKDINKVCEAFAGSFSLIRNIYYNMKKLYCSDNDKELINTLNLISDNLDDYHNFGIEYNKIIEKYPNYNKNKEENNKLKEEIKIYLENNKFNNKIIKDTLSARGLIKPRPKIDYTNFIKLYKKIKWFNDYKEIFNKFKDDKKAFIFLDPPYFSSCNKTYYGQQENEDKYITDGTELFIDILNFMKTCKCKVLLIINKNAITEYIYKDFIKSSYSRTYQLSKSKEILMICSNY